MQRVFSQMCPTLHSWSISHSGFSLTENNETTLLNDYKVKTNSKVLKQKTNFTFEKQ